MKKILQFLAMTGMLAIYLNVRLITFFVFWRGVPNFNVWSSDDAEEIFVRDIKIFTSFWMILIPFILLDFWTAVITVGSISFAVIAFNLIRFAIFKMKRRK